MSVGTVLVALAIATVLVAYVARPFRREEGDPEAQLERWVQEARSQRSETTGRATCPQCGRPVQADHRFCPGCGAPLPEGEET